MWKYKTGEQVKIGDKVLVSKKWCKENDETDRAATVVGLNGFITVEMRQFSDRVDFDTRSLTFVSRKAS